MNREIKFRAWNGFDKSMIYPDGHKYVIQFDGTIGEFNESLQKYETVDWTLQQFIGLKDKRKRDLRGGCIKAFRWRRCFTS